MTLDLVDVKCNLTLTTKFKISCTIGLGQRLLIVIMYTYVQKGNCYSAGKDDYRSCGIILSGWALWVLWLAAPDEFRLESSRYRPTCTVSQILSLGWTVSAEYAYSSLHEVD